MNFVFFKINGLQIYIKIVLDFLSDCVYYMTLCAQEM